MAKYKILVLDLDGTLTNDEKIITPRTYDALMRIQRDGVRIVLASGRPVYGIVPLAEQLHMADYGGIILAYNGGTILDWQTRETLYAQPLPTAMLPTILDAARQGEHEILSYRGEEIIASSAEDKYVKEEARINKMPIRQVDNFLQALPPIVSKCLIVGTPERLAETEKMLAEKTTGQLAVYRSAPFFLEVVAPGIDKAASLSRMLERLQMTPDEIVAVGDGYNDLSMIRYAGMGVAMLNADEPIRKEADMVSPADNNHDGVAEVIDRLFGE